MKSEIELLRQAVDDVFKGLESSLALNKAQADRIAELENEVKRLVGAEPITHGRLTFCKNCGQQDPYTQTKPLSDEEIENIYYKNFNFEDADMVKFARAILRKAQEK